ncbi:MAG: FG-GAP repeat protein, partial [Bacteroidales bacterium]|nr:FG-GAP repeat protein [Bacteroidales bacterium]
MTKKITFSFVAVLLLIFAFSHLTVQGQPIEEIAKLLASDGNTNDQFGISVSISGDYAIVGARRDDDNDYNSSSAYIFYNNGGNWQQHAKITASDGASGDEFGYSVSISGDYAIVGAWLDDDNGGNSGSAYIFYNNGGNWQQQTKMTASDGAANDWFGHSVGISGDYAIVGVDGNDDNGYNSGSAYIFYNNGGNWQQQAKITASDGANSDYFGWSVSISGDYAIVGAFGNDDNGSKSGSAYIFYNNGGNWQQHAK